MPELTVVVRVPLPKQPTLAALEVSIFRALMAAGRDLLTQAFGVLEQGVLTGARQRRRRRYLITRFGEIRFLRWQVRTEQGYGYLKDARTPIRLLSGCLVRDQHVQPDSIARIRAINATRSR